MQELVYIVVLCLVMLVHIYMLFNTNRRCGGVNIYSAVLFTLLLYVDIIPILIFAGGADGVNNSYTAMISLVKECKIEQFALAEFAILLFSIVFHAIYLRFNNRKTSKIYAFDERKMHDIVLCITVLTFIVGGGAFLLYMKAFGGISSMLSYASYFRTFRTNNAEVLGSAVILVVPARLVTVTPSVLWTLIKTSRKWEYVKKFLFVIALFFSTIFLLFNAGKTAVIIMLLSFAIPMLKKWTKHPWALAIIGGCFMLPFLGVLDSLFDYISTGKWAPYSKQATAYIGQFSYVYGNVLNLSEMVDMSGLRWGSDFITGVLNVIPGVDFSASYEITSRLHFGDNWMQVAGVPDDIISFGYLQFGILGVVLVATLLGVISGKLDRLIMQMDYEKYGVIITTVILGVYSYMINADIGVLVKSQFQLTLCSICILYSFSDKYNRHKRIKFTFKGV